MFQNQMTSNGMPPFFPAQFASQTPLEDHNSLFPTLLPTTNPQDLRGGGVASIMYGKRSMSFSGMETCEELNMEEELSDDGAQLGERKKRLNLEQVRTLERNFEMGNKLEPERKIQLARALGLQPRQIAIWFQNKRARWKTKQLEKDYDCLKRQFEAVKAENDALHTQNKRLHAEILSLKGMSLCEPINLNKELEGCCSNRSDNSSDLNLDISKAPTTTTDSPPISQAQQGMTLFPPYTRTPIVSQLFQGSLKVETTNKVEHAAQDEHLCTMFGNIDDQSAFWAWSEQNNFP